MSHPLIEAFFAPGGLLQQALPGYEPRPQQLEMARRVYAALADGRHLAVEAGTGTGKSLAELLPAAIWAVERERRVVVAPHTLQLQEQLLRKDVPLLQRALGDRLPFSVALAKGRGHYLCLNKLSVFGAGLAGAGPGGAAEARGLFRSRLEAEQFGRLVRHCREHPECGEDDAVPFPVLAPVWEAVAVDADTCLGPRCAHFEPCHYFRARRAAAEAEIVIANQSLVFADLALRGRAGQEADRAILPTYHALVLDEAQHAEDAAAGYLTITAGEAEVARVVRVLRAFLGGDGPLGGDRRVAQSLEELGRAIEAAAAAFFRGVNQRCGPYATRYREPLGVADELSPLLQSLAERLRIFAETAASDEQRLLVGGLCERCADLAGRVGRLVAAGWEEEAVYWLEREGADSAAMRACPVDLAEELRANLFAQIPVVFTSATLSSAMIRRIGCDVFDAARFDSPFDYARNALLYVPPRPADPRGGPARETGVAASGVAYDRYTAAQVLALVEAARGRTLVLFTARRSMEAVFELCAERIEAMGYRVFKQGDWRRPELIERFRQDVGSVLFGLASFWEGVDVPGEACSCVIIVKLPFLVPSHPLVEARIERMLAEGRDPFREYQVPEAVLRVKQGFGRLIRSATDRGVVAVLDGRILNAPYGRAFLRALPPVRLTRSLDDVRALLAPPAPR